MTLCVRCPLPWQRHHFSESLPPSSSTSCSPIFSPISRFVFFLPFFSFSFSPHKHPSTPTPTTHTLTHTAVSRPPALPIYMAHLVPGQVFVSLASKRWTSAANTALMLCATASALIPKIHPVMCRRWTTFPALTSSFCVSDRSGSFLSDLIVTVPLPSAGLPLSPTLFSWSSRRCNVSVLPQQNG